MILSDLRNNQFRMSEDGNTAYINGECDILIQSDVHIDDKRKRPLYFFEILSYMDDIIEKLKTLDNPVYIQLGDLFDKALNGSKGLLLYEKVLTRFNEIDRITGGKCFMVYGNHEDTYLDTTPSALLMKPSQNLLDIMVENGREVNREFGTILKTPETIRIGNTKITLFHFRKHNKDYSTITGDSQYHIALFHDTFLNNTMRDKLGGGVPLDIIWKNDMRNLDIKNFDTAIFGDFHIPLQPFRVSNRRNTLVIIPGSYGRNNIATETHDRVYLPIIRVGETTSVDVESFKLIPYQASYNVADKTTDTSNITGKIRNLVNKMKTEHKQEITIDNYHSYVTDLYGKEWGNAIYGYLKGEW